MRAAVHAAAQALRRQHRPGSRYGLLSACVCQQTDMLPAHPQQQQPGSRMTGASSWLSRPQQAAAGTFSRAVQCCASAAGARSRRARQANAAALLDAPSNSQQQLHTLYEELQHLNSQADDLLGSQLDAPIVMQPVAAPAAAAELCMHQDHHQRHAGLATASVHQQQQQQQQQQQKQQQQRYLAHLQQHTLPTEVLLIGIDPDTSGALAVVRSPLHWSLTDGGSSSSKEHVQKSSGNGNGSSSGSTAEVPQLQAFMGLPAAVSVYDMPVQTIVTQTKTHTGKHRVRRRLDILQGMAIVRQVLQDATAATAEQATAEAGSYTVGNGSSNGVSNGSSNGSSNGGSSSGGGRILLRAVVEVAPILPSNGRLATLNQGYSVGAWTALLAAHGFDVTTVHVLSWKKDLGLLKRDKDSSRQLAKALFQQAGVPQDELLRTKNTHGRAEALLLAAWGLGWSAAQGSKEGPTQGPMRATVHMDGGQHSLPVPQQQQQQQLATHPAAAVEVATSDDESSSQMLCMPSGMGALAGAGAMLGVVDHAHLTQCLQLLSAQHSQQPPRILDVSAQIAAVVAAVEAKAAAKQAEKEGRAAARKAAAEQRAAAKAAEKAAKAAAAVERRAAAAAAGGSRRRSRSRPSSPTSAAAADS